MPAVATSIDSGQRIGRYQPIRRLAVGGMAEIYLARLPGVGIEGFEKLVVLKRILPQHALDPELLRMFLDEARLSATLTHPHVTEVYDVGTDGDAPFFAMEYVHGANLRELMRANSRRIKQGTGDDGTPVPLPLEHAIGIVAAAAAGLHYAHDRLGPGGEPLGIVHRDVSPSNVLVSYDGAVKVSDFGIAKWSHQRTRTQEGTLKGKFAYMSPEQCRGRPVDRRSDVFALGAILYELTTGEAPFSGTSDLEILNRIAAGKATPPASPDGAPGYPAALSEIVMRALAPDAADRFPTMQVFQVALESFARGAGLVVSTVALGAFTQDLFAEELAAWHGAQREGKSLAEHLAAHPAATHPVHPEERTATDAFAPTKLRAARRAGWSKTIAAAAFIVLCAVGGALAFKNKDRPHKPDTAAASPADTPAPARSPAAATITVKAEEAMAAPARMASSVQAKTPTKIGRQPRPARGAPPPAPAAKPTIDSRLGAWDPDSPVPP